jgi:hypothetical protein
MGKTSRVKRIVACALLCGGLGLAAAGLGAATAQATDGPFTWCPGQSMDWPVGPNNRFSDLPYSWDMHVCHAWYTVDYGYGNVPRIINGNSTLAGSETWDGDNPPPSNPSGVNCGLFWCPVPPHYDPNFHGS